MRNEITLKLVVERLGLAIEETMKRKKYNIHEVATRAGLDPAYLVRIMDGQEKDLDLGTIFTICEALGVKPIFAVSQAGPRLEKKGKARP